jgi:hypothetical protein
MHRIQATPSRTRRRDFIALPARHVRLQLVQARIGYSLASVHGERWQRFRLPLCSRATIRKDLSHATEVEAAGVVHLGRRGSATLS